MFVRMSVCSWQSDKWEKVTFKRAVNLQKIIPAKVRQPRFWLRERNGLHQVHWQAQPGQLGGGGDDGQDHGVPDIFASVYRSHDVKLSVYCSLKSVRPCYSWIEYAHITFLRTLANAWDDNSNKFLPTSPCDWCCCWCAAAGCCWCRMRFQCRGWCCCCYIFRSPTTDPSSWDQFVVIGLRN